MYWLRFLLRFERPRPKMFVLHHPNNTTQADPTPGLYGPLSLYKGPPWQEHCREVCGSTAGLVLLA